MGKLNIILHMFKILELKTVLKNGNFTSKMAQEEEDRRKTADLQEEEEVRNGSSRFDDQDRRLSRPFGPRQRRKHQEESLEIGPVTSLGDLRRSLARLVSSTPSTTPATTSWSEPRPSSRTPSSPSTPRRSVSGTRRITPLPSAGRREPN